ncbi:hypothetical protein MCEMSEM23_01146 [Rhabdaerophilaceae bacterium]
MTVPWTPPDREASALEEAISAVVRSRLIPTAETGVPMADAQGWVRIKLPNDEEARISISLSEPAQRYVQQRASLAYSFTGHATQALEGHRVHGSALLDLQTKAFLGCQIEIETVGKLG